MPGIRIGRLPDRTPVKLVLSLSPGLAGDLQAYARFYRDAYGEEVAEADLAAAMLEAFLGSDRSFIRHQREKQKGRP